MQLMFYTWITLCGFGVGLGFGAEGMSWIVAPCLLFAAMVSWQLTRPETTPSAPGPLSAAHRAWFSSSGACMLVLVGVWMVFGWRLPSLWVDGLRLDPAGALGWDHAWLGVRLAWARAMLLAGLAGLAWALVSWMAQRRAGKSARILLGWAFAPFFWMASLGLLVGVSQPWRHAPSHSMARKWHRDLPPSQVAALALEAQALSKNDETAAVWAHALGLEAYQRQQWSKPQLDRFLQDLAWINAHRPRWHFLARSSVVGVDNNQWCVMNAARTQQTDRDWVKIQETCATTPPGRSWNWSAR